VTRQVAHRSDDPAEHERGELDDGGLAARGHARGDVTPDRGRCPAPERRLYEMRHGRNTTDTPLRRPRQGAERPEALRRAAFGRRISGSPEWRDRWSWSASASR
jgi:hypothetical protein